MSKHFDWIPFDGKDSPRKQGERLFDMALDVNPANADAQVRFCTSKYPLPYPRARATSLHTDTQVSRGRRMAHVQAVSHNG